MVKRITHLLGILPSLWLLPLVFLSSEAAFWFLLASALVLGLPHGATDIVVGPRLMPFKIFLGIYLALAIPPLLLLWMWPALGLWTLLMLALWHWGRGEEKGLLGFLRASIVIFLPLLQLETIKPFLDVFAKGYTPPRWTALIVLVFIPLALREKPSLWQWLDTAILALVALLAHPYALIGGYFIVHHSYGHLKRLKEEGWLSRKDYLPTALTTLGGLAIALFLYPFFQDPLAAYIGATFALTLPHALIVTIWEERVRFPNIAKATCQRHNALKTIS